MTDDLIARLRCYPANRLCRQVADALEAKDRRINEISTGYIKLELEKEKQRARIAELKAALKPFADKATVYPDLPDNWLAHVTMKHLRAARAAYMGEKE